MPAWYVGSCAPPELVFGCGGLLVACLPSVARRAVPFVVLIVRGYRVSVFAFAVGSG